jgi:hypothetical protein
MPKPPGIYAERPGDELPATPVPFVTCQGLPFFDQTQPRGHQPPGLFFPVMRVIRLPKPASRAMLVAGQPTLDRAARARQAPFGGWPCLVCTSVRSCVVPKSSRSSFAKAQTRPGRSLGVGAKVRLRQRQTTGVVIGYSPQRNRVRVRWDDTGEVAHILIANLERVPAVSK